MYTKKTVRQGLPGHGQRYMRKRKSRLILGGNDKAAIGRRGETRGNREG